MNIRMRGRFYFTVRVGAAIAVLAVLTSVAVPSIRWRAEVVLLKAAGQIPDIEWHYLIPLLLPASQQSLARLIDTRSPYGVIHNPNTAADDVKAGGDLFRAKCAICHGPDGRGGVAAPALAGVESSQGTSDWAMFRTIRYGVPNTAMPAHPIPEIQLWQLVAYIGFVDSPSSSVALPKPVIERSVSAVTYEDLRSTKEPSNDWLTYSGSYSSARHSALAQISPENVDQLAPR